MTLPKVLAILPALIPSTIIDVVTPLMDLNKSGYITARITVETFISDGDIEWCDLVVLCRNTHPNSAAWFLQILKLGKPYIYDLDDNLFDMPANTPLGKYHREPSRIRMLEEYIRLANLVRVYSTPMLERAKELNRSAVKVTAPLDWRLIQPAPKPSTKQLVKLVYSTSRVDDYLADIFKPALKCILDKYQNYVEVHFLGYKPSEFRIYQNVFFHSLMFDYETYLKEFSSAGYDVGLAPLLDDVFHRSKTNNKFREYGASHVAGIYSNVDVYSACVTHDQTGFLVENTTDAWYDAMSTLIENDDLRSKIKESAFRFVRENYSQEAFSSQWHQQITTILHKPALQVLSTMPMEKLIFENTGSNPLMNILKKLIRQAANPTAIKDKLVNYAKMYWVLLKIRYKLSRMKSE